MCTEDFKAMDVAFGGILFCWLFTQRRILQTTSSLPECVGTNFMPGLERAAGESGDVFGSFACSFY